MTMTKYREIRRLSGTTLGAAFELGRPWIGVDCGNESFKAILKRFISGLEAYGDYVSNNTYSQCTMNLLDKCPFDVWRDETTKDMMVKAMHEIEESNSNF